MPGFLSFPDSAAEVSALGLFPNNPANCDLRLVLIGSVAGSGWVTVEWAGSLFFKSGCSLVQPQIQQRKLPCQSCNGPCPCGQSVVPSKPDSISKDCRRGLRWINGGRSSAVDFSFESPRFFAFVTFGAFGSTGLPPIVAKIRAASSCPFSAARSNQCRACSKSCSTRSPVW